MAKPGLTDLVVILLLVFAFAGGATSSGLPVSDPGLHVLIIEETEERGKLTEDQRAVLASVPMVTFLDENCTKINGRAQWRVWDKDTDITREADKWRKLMAIPRESLPWMYVWNGRRGASGPLPATVDDTRIVISKYAGKK